MEALSIQQLLDCSWGYNNNGCRGGWSWRAFQFVKDHGLATTKSYGKYLGQVTKHLLCIKKGTKTVKRLLSLDATLARQGRNLNNIKETYFYSHIFYSIYFRKGIVIVEARISVNLSARSPIGPLRNIILQN